MSCDRKYFLGNSNVKSTLYKNKFKIFPTRHHITLPDWWTHCSRWIGLHKNHQMHVWNKTGSYHSLQAAFFSHGSTWLLYSALHNWNLGTQDQKNKMLPICRWFWSEIFYQRWYKPFSIFPKKHYVISTDWEGCNYIELKVYWNNSEKYVDILIPEYVKKALDIIQHPKPKIPQYAPHFWTVPAYWKRPQMSPYPDNSNIIDNKSTKRIQCTVGIIIYYS